MNVASIHKMPMTKSASRRNSLAYPFRPRMWKMSAIPIDTATVKIKAWIESSRIDSPRRSPAQAHKANTADNASKTILRSL